MINNLAKHHTGNQKVYDDITMIVQPETKKYTKYAIDEYLKLEVSSETPIGYLS